MKTIYDCSLLVVDDEPELLSMVERILRQAGFYRIHTARDCRRARESFCSIRPGCVLLDVMLPDGDGFSLMREFRASSAAPVLFLSARDEDENRLLGLGLGADDYITKPFLPRELTLRLCAVLTRAYFPAVLRTQEKPRFLLGGRCVDLASGTVTDCHGGQWQLTAKEYILIEKLYENRGSIVTLDALCRAAWDDAMSGYENTLMVHMRRLREKVEETPSRPQWIQTVRGLGYKLVKEEER